MEEVRPNNIAHLHVNSNGGDEQDFSDIHFENSPHSQGIFSMTSNFEEEEQNKNRNSGDLVDQKQESHIASAEIMRKIVGTMKSVAKFTKSTKQSNRVMTQCNDIFLVNVRNVKMTSKQGGERKLCPLENNTHIVTIVSRSRGHFIKMMKSMLKSIRKFESGDENYNNYECNYIFTMDENGDENNGENSIKKYMESIDDERNKYELLNDNETE